MRWAAIPFLLALATPVASQSAVEFQTQIWPIVQTSCFPCHSTQERNSRGRLMRPEGGVTLDSAEGIKSSLAGEVVVAGDAEGSLLYWRITRPPGHDDIMPPADKGKPLTREQTDLIRQWIERGADFGMWSGVQPEAKLAAVGRDMKKPSVLPPITSLAFAPDGKSVVSGSQAGVRVYSWPDLRPRTAHAVGFDNLHDIAFSPDGERLAVGGGFPARDGRVETLSWPWLESLAAVQEQKDSVTSIAWRDENTLASASLDHSIALWNMETGSLLRRLQGHSRGVTAICFLRDGKTLVSAGIDQSVRVWDLDSGGLVRGLNQHTGPVHALALRPTAEGLPMVASAAGDRTLRFWQPTIGRMVRFVRLESAPLDIAWLDAGKVAAACRDGRLRIVSADTVEVIQDLPAVTEWAYSLAVHPTDGSVVVGGQNGEIRRVVPRQDSKNSR